MISIGQAENLQEKNLIKDWSTTLSLVILTLLNGDCHVDGGQVLMYMHKLGKGLFLNSTTEKQRYMALFLIYSARVQSLYEFLDLYGK
jgi:hypothetical protein